MPPPHAFGFNVREDFGAIGDGISHHLSERYASLAAAQVDYPAATSVEDEIDRAAFQKALDTIAAQSPAPDYRGDLLLVPYGFYHLDKTLYIIRPLILQGVSGAGGSTLYFAQGIDGIVVEHAGMSADGGGGQWCVIRDLLIQSTNLFGVGHSVVPAVNEDDPLTADPKAHSGHPVVTGSGIVLYDRAIIENCTITGFQYDGIHIEALDPQKNANTWALRTCRLISNGRHGFFNAGGQNGADAGIAVGVGGMANSGWALYDRSFYGNTFVGCYAEGNGHDVVDIRCLLIHYSGVYAGTADGGVQWSPDGGGSWSAINRGLNLTRDGPGEKPGDPPIAQSALLPTVQALAVADVNTGQAPQVLYAGTDPGWQLDPALQAPAGARIVGAAVFSSDDRGNLWNLVGTDHTGLTEQDVRAVAVVPTAQRPITVYAGTAGGVFTSPDGGTTWAGANTGLASPDVRALAIEPRNSETIYAGTAGGVFKTTDGGTTWAGANTGLAAPDVRALAIDPQTPATVYAGTTAGVYKTLDAGGHWIGTDIAGGNPPDVRALAVDPHATATVYAGHTDGVFKTTDAGDNWMDTNRAGLTSLEVRALAIDPDAPATVYAGTAGGVFKTIDGGDNWEATTQTYYGGAFKTPNPSAKNVFVGSYSESGQGSGSDLAYPTLVLGGPIEGGFGPLTNASLVTNVIPGLEGIVELPIRSATYHRVRHLIGDPIKGGVFGVNDGAIDDVILVDASVIQTIIGVPPAAPGQELTIKKVDGTANTVMLRPTEGSTIEGSGQDVFLNNDLTMLALVSTGGDWRIIGRLSA